MTTKRIKELEKLYKKVCRMRYDKGMTLVEIGKELGYSKQRVYQILTESEDILAARRAKVERRERVLTMRDQGYKFDTISRKLGLCEDYVKKIYRDARGSTVE